MRITPTFTEELDLAAQGYRLVAGVDEVGRGPLAGPVVAAAVILPEDWLRWRGPRRRGAYSKKRRGKGQDPREILRDSKELTRLQRDRLYTVITGIAVAYGLGSASHEVIDSKGIVPATKMAMREAISSLAFGPDALLVDAIDLSEVGLPCRPIINGDALCGSIAAGSIVAKVTRDRLMEEMDTQFPGYGFAQHKGYATREHLRSLRRLGPCPIHRRSFAPVRDLLMRPRLF